MNDTVKKSKNQKIKKNQKKIKKNSKKNRKKNHYFSVLLLMTSTAVEDCILSVDSIIRLGGAVADDDSDDESERIQNALNSAGEKYGLHFEGQEARILEDPHGNYNEL